MWMESNTNGIEPGRIRENLGILGIGLMDM